MARRLAFFMFVLAFAGSVVLIAAHDLKRNRFAGEKGDPEEARKLIKALSGHPLSKVGSEEVVEAEMMPQRNPGQYLANSDKKSLSSAIRQIVPHAAEEK